MFARYFTLNVPPARSRPEFGYFQDRFGHLNALQSEEPEIVKRLVGAEAFTHQQLGGAGRRIESFQRSLWRKRRIL
jgi:hypothetical protein